LSLVVTMIDDDVVKVSKKNLMEIVKKLMVHMDKAEGSHYRDELLSKIIEICSQSNYQFITNFEWYAHEPAACSGSRLIQCDR